MICCLPDTFLAVATFEAFIRPCPYWTIVDCRFELTGIAIEDDFTMDAALGEVTTRGLCITTKND